MNDTTDARELVRNLGGGVTFRLNGREYETWPMGLTRTGEDTRGAYVKVAVWSPGGGCSWVTVRPEHRVKIVRDPWADRR
jgi:hypothetical protein